MFKKDWLGLRTKALTVEGSGRERGPFRTGAIMGVKDEDEA